MLYSALFSYRENNEVAGHAVGSAAREPIEHGVGRYLQAQEVACQYPKRKYQRLPT